MNGKSKSMLWKESLQQQTKKLNKKDLAALLAPYIISIVETGQGQNKLTTIVGTNFLGSQIELRNRKEEDALADLATLNGYTVI